MAHNTPQNTKILVAEDNPDDSFLLLHAFTSLGLHYSVTTVQDGEAVINYLSNHSPPNLVLLDLKLPKRTGFEVLKWLQRTPGLGHITVVVYSSSNLPEDKERARELGAAEYYIKSADMRPMVKDLETRFFNHGD